MHCDLIGSIEDFINQIRADCKEWDTVPWFRGPWFRGEPNVATPLLPKLYRPKKDGSHHDENTLLQSFRMRAPSLGFGQAPDRNTTDQWLFLARHVGLPTRLLDWTEGALAALYFALLEEKPIVWMLNPIELNRLSVPDPQSLSNAAFDLTWVPRDPPDINIAHENIRGAWEMDARGVALPVAIVPTHIHTRMSAQRSCFTVHGKKKDCLNNLIPPKYLKRYAIDPAKAKQMQSELRILGISHSTLFPDLDGLAKELSITF